MIGLTILRNPDERDYCLEKWLGYPDGKTNIKDEAFSDLATPDIECNFKTIPKLCIKKCAVSRAEQQQLN